MQAHCPVAVTDLTTFADLEAAVRASDEAPVVLFKHSRSCLISMRAQWSMDELGHDDPDLYRVVVQTSRPVSDEIARRFGVWHESPQVLLVFRGDVLAHWSHGNVRAATVREYLAQQPLSHDRPYE